MLFPYVSSLHNSQNNINKLHKLHFPFHLLHQKCGEFFQLFRRISVDVPMIQQERRTTSTKYRPEKPTKWVVWILLYVMYKKSYNLDFIIYTGMVESKEETLITWAVVSKFLVWYEHQGHSAFTDNFYTSAAPAENLVTLGASSVCTLLASSRGTQECFKGVKTFENFQLRVT